MKNSPITLEGRQVRLEPLADVHMEALTRHGNDTELWRYMKHARPNGADSVRAWGEAVRAAQAKGDGAAWAIVNVANGEAVGGTTYLDVVPADKRLEIGNTWLGKAVWRTAINTEAKLLLLRHAFETLGCNRVQLKTDARNERSQAAIARLGAVREGVLRAHMVMPDGWLRDTVMFSILAPEWPAVRARLEARRAG
jgi:RimJ/RimL family protein N-acetyltransferase